MVTAPAALVLALGACVSSSSGTPPPATSSAGTTTSPTASTTAGPATGTSSAPMDPTATTSSTPPSSGPTSATANDPPAAGTPRTTSTSWSCTANMGDGCGAYSYAGIPNSNGYNTYVSNQPVGPQAGTTQTVYANSPADWKVVARNLPLGYRGVQTFPDVQQLFNNWCGKDWSGCPNPTGTPLDALSTLEVTYGETSPTGPNDLYEFAVDAWSDNYGADVMFWVDTHGRCDEGAFGGTLLGHAVIGGQHWTVHRYGGPGDEIIFVLDGPGGAGTCAQQRSGTIDVKAGFDWLSANGFAKGPHRITQLNTGWEITSADHATFAVHAYSIRAVPR